MENIYKIKTPSAMTCTSKFRLDQLDRVSAKVIDAPNIKIQQCMWVDVIILRQETVVWRKKK